MKRRHTSTMLAAVALGLSLLVTVLVVAAYGDNGTASTASPVAASPSPTAALGDDGNVVSPASSSASEASTDESASGDRVVRLNADADNPTYLDVPGTASAAQTEAVARRFAAALAARTMDRAGLYADDATQDVEGGGARGAALIERYWYDAYHEDPGIIAVRHWSKDYHLLLAPGIAVYEGSRLNNDLDDDWRWSLRLLAVDGDQIAHEEVYYVGNGLEDRWPMTFCQTPPGPGDTAEVAAQVAAAVGQAFATRDRAALEALLAPDVIFPELDDRPGVSGRQAFFDWWAMLAPRNVSKIVVKDETPLAGPGWAVLRMTARLWMDRFLPDGVLVSANVATVIEVRDGKVARIVPYGTAEMGMSGLVPLR